MTSSNYREHLGDVGPNSSTQVEVKEAIDHRRLGRPWILADRSRRLLRGPRGGRIDRGVPLGCDGGRDAGALVERDHYSADVLVHINPLRLGPFDSSVS